MSAVLDFAQPTKMPEKPCGECGGVDFDLFQRGPHIGRQCITCGHPGGWVSRAELGLGKRNIKREEISYQLRCETLQRWKHRCAWCGIPASDALMHVGHIIPRAKVLAMYGEELADHPLNLAPSCETCNAGAHLTNEFAVDLLMAALRLGAQK